MAKAVKTPTHTSVPRMERRKATSFSIPSIRAVKLDERIDAAGSYRLARFRPGFRDGKHRAAIALPSRESRRQVIGNRAAGCVDFIFGRVVHWSASRPAPRDDDYRQQQGGEGDDCPRRHRSTRAVLSCREGNGVGVGYRPRRVGWNGGAEKELDSGNN